MNKNPYVNAVLASAYIGLVATLLQNAHYIFGEQDNFFAPIIFISTFVLSAAIMGYLFVAEPVQLYLDGHKKQAVTHFWHTVMTFAGITFVIVIISAAFF